MLTSHGEGLTVEVLSIRNKSIRSQIESNLPLEGYMQNPKHPIVNKKRRYLLATHVRLLLLRLVCGSLNIYWERRVNDSSLNVMAYKRLMFPALPNSSLMERLRHHTENKGWGGKVLLESNVNE